VKIASVAVGCLSLVVGASHLLFTARLLRWYERFNRGRAAINQLWIGRSADSARIAGVLMFSFGAIVTVAALR
jgi:hypothetical protein